MLDPSVAEPPAAAGLLVVGAEPAAAGRLLEGADVDDALVPGVSAAVDAEPALHGTAGTMFLASSSPRQQPL